MSEPADRIERFLRDNPSGMLSVTVGFASAFGLAWLSEQTRGRPVRLLIGDTRTGFTNYSESDRRAAIRFIRRPEVSVRNWYRKQGGYRTAHAKGWIVEPDPRAGLPAAILVGSANLTKQGLFRNVEMLALADPQEHERLLAEMRQLMEESWPIEDRLLQLLGATREGVRPRGPGEPGPRGNRHDSQNPRGREFRNGVAVATAGLVLLLLLFGVGRACDDNGSPAATSTARTVSDPQPATGSTGSTVGSPASDPPVPTVPATLAARPEIESSAPPGEWVPEVGGNVSSFGEPGRDALQWVAWQPDCPSCESGVTMTWVGSYAFPFNQGVGYSDDLRPKLQSACFHRERSGPLIDWQRDISSDRVEALWIDGESVPSGSWWIGGIDRSIMVPEPEPFLDLIRDARQLRIVTAEGRDATFVVEDFLATPVQANLDYCSHYP